MPRQNFLVDIILECFDRDLPFVPYEDPYTWMRRKRKQDYKRSQYQQSLWKLRHRGFLEVVEKNSQRFIKLTEKGQLETLLRKAGVVQPKAWDGKWRLITFDIPEKSKHKRDGFRRMLLKNNFVKLQSSVFVNPYPLNQEALEYLKQEGLMAYIRMLRVDNMDDDSLLRRKFKL